MQFPPTVLSAVQKFARRKPWRGSLAERKRKLRKLNRDLAKALGRTPPKLVLRGVGSGDSGDSYYRPADHAIVLLGRLSVVTFLHEWGHLLHGHSELAACRFSLNLFRLCLPRSWARLRFDRHMVRAQRQ